MNDPRLAGALFDFLGYLTTLPEPLTLGGRALTYPALEHLEAWAKTRELELQDANVEGWTQAPVCPYCSRIKAPVFHFAGFPAELVGIYSSESPPSNPPLHCLDLVDALVAKALTAGRESGEGEISSDRAQELAAAAARVRLELLRVENATLREAAARWQWFRRAAFSTVDEDANPFVAAWLDEETLPAAIKPIVMEGTEAWGDRPEAVDAIADAAMGAVPKSAGGPER